MLVPGAIWKCQGGFPACSARLEARVRSVSRLLVRSPDLSGHRATGDKCSSKWESAFGNATLVKEMFRRRGAGRARSNSRATDYAKSAAIRRSRASQSQRWPPCVRNLLTGLAPQAGFDLILESADGIVRVEGPALSRRPRTDDAGRRWPAAGAGLDDWRHKRAGLEAHGLLFRAGGSRDAVEYAALNSAACGDSAHG
jgi:hypothetical protein